MAQTYSLQRQLISSLLVCLLPVATLIPSTQALNNSDVCTPSSIYTPFTKWPHDFLLIPGSTENIVCWWWAECVISQAPEVRKQQFAATSLVMGLVPLILKDIAWPERRLVSVPSPLNVVVEVLVRALGLIPVVKDDAKLVRLPRRFSKRCLGVATLVLLIFSLLGLYAMLIVTEFFSKRSSLGCPYPLFICTWFIVALIPAAIQSFALRSPFSPRKRKASGLLHPKPVVWHAQTTSRAGASEPVESTKPSDAVEFTPVSPSAIPGEEQQWWIQLIWAVYYGAGTLVFSSIMAVTVIELVVWVILSCVTVAASKLLAFRLCGNWQ